MWAETYDICNSEKGACGFALQHFEALRNIGKGCQAEPRLCTSLHSYCKDAGQWEGFVETLAGCDDRHSLLSG